VYLRHTYCCAAVEARHIALRAVVHIHGACCARVSRGARADKAVDAVGAQAAILARPRPHSSMSSAHVCPVKPAAHVHVNWLTPSRHVPPFKHGCDSQSSMSVSPERAGVAWRTAALKSGPGLARPVQGNRVQLLARPPVEARDRTGTRPRPPCS
jgi:hypothetical protein